MDWEPGGEEKEAKDEKAGAGSGTEPVALLSWVIDERRAGPGMSVAVSLSNSAPWCEILTLICAKAQGNVTSLAIRVAAAEVQTKQVILKPAAL